MHNKTRSALTGKTLIGFVNDRIGRSPEIWVERSKEIGGIASMRVSRATGPKGLVLHTPAIAIWSIYACPNLPREGTSWIMAEGITVRVVVIVPATDTSCREAWCANNRMEVCLTQREAT